MTTTTTAMTTARALNAIRSDRVRVNATFAALDDDLAATAGWDRRDTGAAFSFLGAVIEARFLVLRHALTMTLEVINE